EDPGEVLLRLIAQVSRRCRKYAAELEAKVNAEGLAAAMTGQIEIPTKHGSYVQGEYIRALAQLEAQERDRAANFATKGIAAGLAERQVRMMERQGELFAQGVRLIIERLNLSQEQVALLPAAVEAAVVELAC